jgi:hypothetical protein
MKPRKVATLTAVLLTAGVMAGPALALTAEDVMDRMESKERHGFLGGAVSMAAHLYAIDGNREKGECALNWFFRIEDSLRQIHRFFDAHKEKDPIMLLAILIDRRCGK